MDGAHAVRAVHDIMIRGGKVQAFYFAQEAKHTVLTETESLGEVVTVEELQSQCCAQSTPTITAQ